MSSSNEKGNWQSTRCKGEGKLDFKTNRELSSWRQSRGWHRIKYHKHFNVCEVAEQSVLCLSVPFPPSLLFILIHPIRELDCTMANTWLDCRVGVMNSYSRTGSLGFIYLFIHFAAAVKKKKQKTSSSHMPSLVPILLMFSYFIHEKHQWRAGGVAWQCMCLACLEL